MKNNIRFCILTAILGIAMYSCGDDDKPEKKDPVITITTQPTATTTVTAGSITGSLTVAANVTEGATLSYQWYSNTTASSTGGTAVSGATSVTFLIPTTLAAGTYFYFCEVSATGGATVIRSDVATVTVNAAGVTLVSIAVTTQPSKKTYTVGEAFNPSGMVVTATYSDGTTTPITLTAEMLTYDFSTAGENKTVTITYEGKTATVNGITVNPAIIRTVTVGEQDKVLIAGTEGTVIFSVTTENISNFSYQAVVANLPAGVSVQADRIDIINNAGKFTLVGNASTVASVTTLTLTLTVNGVGVTSAPFNLTISAPVFAGSGTNANPFLIGTAAELAKLAELVNAGDFAYNNENKYYKLTADINLNVAPYNTGKGWTPIGGNMPETSGGTYSFNGHFNGNNKKVSGLYINTDHNYVGLFGYISEGSVQDLGVEGSVTGGNNSGGLSGHISSANVSNCYANVVVSGWNNVGGITGAFSGVWKGGATPDEGYLTNCYATGTVSGLHLVGGVAGYVGSGGIMTNCHATGNVIGNENSFQIGGVAGHINQGSMSNCYATGAVSGDRNVGGVAGEIGGYSTFIGSVSNCYAKGAVSGEQGIGGIAGWCTVGSISNCYTTGAVSGTIDFAGLVGFVENSVVENCAALNPNITRNAGSSSSSYGRVFSNNTSGTNNIAWADMVFMPGGSPLGSGTANNKDGEDITTTAIKTGDGTLGNRFTTANGWIVENGKLPGFGVAVSLPSHLQ